MELSKSSAGADEPKKHSVQFVAMAMHDAATIQERLSQKHSVAISPFFKIPSSCPERFENKMTSETPLTSCSRVVIGRG